MFNNLTWHGLPDLQLVDGGSAEGIRRAQQHDLPCAFKLAASLPMVVVLPTPLTPITIMIDGLVARSSALSPESISAMISLSRAFDQGGVGNPPLLDACTKAGTYLR
jgi:hypothetical protein